MNCPVCGRFIGNYVRCPYCGAYVQDRKPVFWLRILSILMILVGFAGVLYFYQNTPVKLVKASELKEVMNFAYARLKGRIVRVGFYSGSATILLDDGSGRIIRINAYSNVANKLKAKGIDVGCEVDVVGQVRWMSGDVRLYLTNADDFKILSCPEKSYVTLSEVFKEKIGSRVLVKGKLKFERDLAGKGFAYSLYEENSAASPVALKVIFWKNSFDIGKSLDGKIVEISGVIKDYKGEREIIVSDFKILE